MPMAEQMKHGVWRWAVLFVSAMYVSAFGGGEASKPLPPGTEAPSFSLPTLSGGRETLRIWCGKKLAKPYVNKVPHTVVLSFWATYCKPCQKEIPELMKFAEKNKDEALKIFCISLDKEGASVVAPFVKEKGYALPVLLDPYKRTAQRYGVKTLPALVVIGPDGVVRYSSVGYKADVPFQKILKKAVASAKDGKNMSAAEGEGESVDVRLDAEDTSSVGAVSPRERWKAVARVESGESLADVADELGIEEEQIKKWYEDLKKAAIELWKEEK
ncbi:MAG: redoxin domain-containing protein [Chitinivibrionales bacterium]|nr:redoxin domain-containing protein [Chitinivibrionales bacterium]MBD3396158.1 redoxin domain-containing protein [Chitinivibrionales bacterium]